ncbi:MAG: glycosyltransferase family 2 protein, partial [Cyanobacteriota bacterium]
MERIGLILPKSLMLVFALCCLGLLLAQGSAVLILLSRLLKGARRRAPLKPQPRGDIKPASVSVVVPTLNEVRRLEPCLQGLATQGPGVREMLVVDSRSQDGTREKVLLWRQQEPRLELLTDDLLPPGWVG